MRAMHTYCNINENEHAEIIIINENYKNNLFRYIICKITIQVKGHIKFIITFIHIYFVSFILYYEFKHILVLKFLLYIN